MLSSFKIISIFDSSLLLIEDSSLFSFSSFLSLMSVPFNDIIKFSITFEPDEFYILWINFYCWYFGCTILDFFLLIVFFLFFCFSDISFSLLESFISSFLITLLILELLLKIFGLIFNRLSKIIFSLFKCFDKLSNK